MENEGKGISESIYDNSEVIIPMAEVQHIEYLKHPTIGANGIAVIMKSTRWDKDLDTWANSIHIPELQKQDFISSWCFYRNELENNLKVL